jgi:hypothetical protein
MPRIYDQDGQPDGKENDAVIHSPPKESRGQIEARFEYRQHQADTGNTVSAFFVLEKYNGGTGAGQNTLETNKGLSHINLTPCFYWCPRRESDAPHQD